MACISIATDAPADPTPEADIFSCGLFAALVLVWLLGGQAARNEQRWGRRL